MTSPTAADPENRCRLCGTAIDPSALALRRVCSHCGEIDWRTLEPKVPTDQRRWLVHLLVLSPICLIAAAIAVPDLIRSGGKFQGLMALLTFMALAPYLLVSTVGVAIFAKSRTGVVLVHGAVIAAALSFLAGRSFLTHLTRRPDRPAPPPVLLQPPPVLLRPPPVSTLEPVPAPPGPAPQSGQLAPEPPEPPGPPLSEWVKAELAANQWTTVTEDCKRCSLEAVIASLVPVDAADCGTANPACVLEKLRGSAPFKGSIPMQGIDSKVIHVYLRTSEGTTVMLGYDSSASGGLGRCAQAISIFECATLQKTSRGELECVRPAHAGTCRDQRIGDGLPR